MRNETIIELAAVIVSAHIANNHVSADDVAQLIESVYAALANAVTPSVLVVPQAPAATVRSSIKAGAITCLECGKKRKMLKRHLSIDHGLSPAEYRAKWKLSPDYPLVAPEYAARRSELAKKIGLGRGSKKRAAAKKTRMVPTSMAIIAEATSE
ncbi:MAG: MucR family transcriptional regulator [Novosphingobium sp.]|nr:MucR family transcriptional regulator [Alphaproteobacteria bacterium]MCB2075922.1 MucR family transcriptional regulator [Novosphingobium sp.]